MDIEKTKTNGAANVNTKHGGTFHMTLCGPEGLKAKLIKSFGFLGHMISLWPVEFTFKDAYQEEQKFGVTRYVVDEVPEMKD